MPRDWGRGAFDFCRIQQPGESIKRIRNRVAHGGHFVPDSDVRRRYARSMVNVPEAIRLAD
jgi:predicted ABC-type ATPase